MKKSTLLKAAMALFLLFSAVGVNAQCTNCFQGLSISNPGSGCTTVFTWTSTGQDATLHHFSIQRSEDGTNYYEIATVNPVAGSTGNYSFTDGNPPMNGTFNTNITYRVMAVRSNGTGTVSSSTTLLFHCTPLPPDIFPCNNSPFIDAPAVLTTCSGTQFISVANATHQTTLWTSSDPSKLLIGSSYNFSHGTAIIPQSSTGTVTITATQPGCGNRSFPKTIVINSCPVCNINPTPSSAFRGCNGSPTCPYENFNWFGDPGASLYAIEFVVSNPSLGQTRPTKYFETPGGVVSGNLMGGTYYPREILSGNGWVITFRVKAKCSSNGQWGNYSSWSSQFAY